MSLKIKKPQSLSKRGTDIHSDFLMEPLRRIGKIPDPGNIEIGAGNVDKSTQHSPLLPAQRARFYPPFSVFYPWTPGIKAVCPAGMAPT